MRTRNYFKYLLAAIVAIGTSVNGLAQEKNLRLYFNEYTGNDNAVPQLILKGDVPEGVAVTQEGYKWAGKYLATAFNKPNCEDRVWADKDRENRSHATLSFTNFKYEVKEVKWNRMNDVFSTQLWEKLKNSAQLNIFSAIGNFLSAFQYDVAFTPADVEQPSKSVTSGSWFVLGKQMSFAKASLISNANLAGLKSISLEEHYAREQKLEDYCRIFLKAGVKGEAEPSTNDYAFQVTYYEPTLAYTSAMPSNLVIGDQKNVAYQITHAGAFEFNEAHYTYSSSNTDVIEVDGNGVMTAIAEGSADITMTIKSTDGMVEKSVTKTVEVYSLNSALRFFHVDRNTNLVDNRANVLVSNMDHQKNSGDVDYTLTNISSNGFTLKSSSSRNFRVGFVPFGLNVASPKYTKVTPSWTFNVENSKNNDSNQGQATINSGMEILYLQNGKDYDNIKNINVNTNDNQTSTGNYSIIKRYNSSKIENTSVNTSTLSANNYNFVYDNSQIGTTSEKQYYFAAVAYTRETNSQVEVHSNFSYSENAPSYEYFAYINYVMGEGCPFAKPNNQTIHSTSTSEGSNLNSVSNVTGYIFKGWSLIEGASVADYENGAKFIPYDDVDGGGKGYVTLHAVWEAKKYNLSLNHNGGTNTISYVPVTFNEMVPDMPESAIPTKRGYTFEGYYNSSGATKYYDAEMKGQVKWLFDNEKARIVAHWTPKTTVITFDPQGGNGGPDKLTASYGQSLPNAWAPSHSDYGYEFKGYFTETEGRGKQYYSVVNNNVVGIGQWDRQEESITLYAYWTPKTYTLTLKHNDGTNVEDNVQVTYTQSMPTAPKPNRLGYEFEGYYRWDNTQFYDKDMNSVQSWDLRNDSYLEAHWTPIKYVLTLNGGSNTVIPTTNFGNGTHAFTVSEDRTTITMDVSLEENLGLFHNGVPKKPGFKFVGFYVDDILVAEATGDKGRNLEFTNNAYINNSVWKYTGNLTLTAKWVPKYTLSDNVLTFNNGEYLEVGKDWQSGKVNDLLGATEYEVQQGNISSNNPVMAFDIRNAIYQDGSSNNADDLMQSLQNKSYISPNVLVYVGPDAYSEVKVNNVIRPSGQGDEAKFNNLVVTDRYPIKIIDDFTAQTAIYERNKAYINDDNDAMWQQSKDSKWGTLCLPYPIKNNQKYDKNGVKYTIRFYELHNTYGNGQGQEYMQFYEMKDADQVIAANTPVLYCRTEGSAGSDITVKATDVEVHANAGYGTNLVDYKEKVDRKEAEESVMYWKFVGTLQTKEYCGAEYNGRVADGVYQNIENKMGATFIDHNKMEIYFFESDKFKKLSKKGKIILYPYRAFFEDHTITYLEQSGESKVSSYSILVVDADGTTTDITNLVGNSNAKGDGKIYDLSGRRVKQPVKGSIYIVDGKKKMY